MKIDRCCDYIPVVSTITNLVDLFQKCIYSAKSNSVQPKTRYYEHIKDKKWTRCLILILPFVGNAIVGISDLIKRKRSSRDNGVSPRVEHIVSINDIPADQIKDFRISGMCAESFPCRHKANVFLVDGRVVPVETSEEISALLKKLPDAKINPEEQGFNASRVREHFEIYRRESIEDGEETESISFDSLRVDSVLPFSLDLSLPALEDVKNVAIADGCSEGYPCTHTVTITLMNGVERTRELNAGEIWSIIDSLSEGIINSKMMYDSARVKEHFKKYKLHRNADGKSYVALNVLHDFFVK